MGNAKVSERALVLGGGGASGNAWLVGIIAGLFDAGLDVTLADLIIGTSAGSTAAAQITSAPPTELLAAILAVASLPRPESDRSDRKAAPIRPHHNHMETTTAIITAAKDATDMRQRMGAWALERSATLGDAAQMQWRAIVAARLPIHLWPHRRMLVTAVNAHTGEPIVFDRHSEVDLIDAVAASTAGGFACRIGDNWYIDGGYRADVNADLAIGYGRVLVIVPLGDKTRKPLAWGLHLAAQVEELRARGSSVEIIIPDNDSQNAIGIGMHLMDLSTRRPAAQAGYNQGKALAGRITFI